METFGISKWVSLQLWKNCFQCTRHSKAPKYSPHLNRYIFFIGVSSSTCLKYFLLTMLVNRTMLCIPVGVTAASTDGHLLQLIHRLGIRASYNPTSKDHNYHLKVRERLWLWQKKAIVCLQNLCVVLCCSEVPERNQLNTPASPPARIGPSPPSTSTEHLTYDINKELQNRRIWMSLRY